MIHNHSDFWILQTSSFFFFLLNIQDVLSFTKLKGPNNQYIRRSEFMPLLKAFVQTESVSMQCSRHRQYVVIK